MIAEPAAPLIVHPPLSAVALAVAAATGTMINAYEDRDADGMADQLIHLQRQGILAQSALMWAQLATLDVQLDPGGSAFVPVHRLDLTERGRRPAAGAWDEQLREFLGQVASGSWSAIATMRAWPPLPADPDDPRRLGGDPDGVASIVLSCAASMARRPLRRPDPEAAFLRGHLAAVLWITQLADAWADVIGVERRADTTEIPDATALVSTMLHARLCGEPTQMSPARGGDQVVLDFIRLAGCCLASIHPQLGQAEDSHVTLARLAPGSGVPESVARYRVGEQAPADAPPGDRGATWLLRLACRVAQQDGAAFAAQMSELAGRPAEAACVVDAAADWLQHVCGAAEHLIEAGFAAP
jgi:hypothetical protein